MLVVIQRVTKASITIENKIHAEIDCGYVIFVGITKEDDKKVIDKLIDKIINLRVMSDEKGKMNRSILEIKGEILVVSQFTLCANLKGGRRPDFFPAMEPVIAEKLYNLFIEKLKETNLVVRSGRFAEDTKITLVNDGPVTIIIDSKTI